MALSQTSVLKLYGTVIEDVISGVREAFLDEGVDEQVLLELKQIWENKLMSSKAVEMNPDPPEPQPPTINSHKSSSKGSKKNSNAANAQANIHQIQTVPEVREPPSPPSILPDIQPPPQPQLPPQPVHIPQPQPQQIQHVQQHVSGIPVPQPPPQQHQQVVNQIPPANERQVSIQIKLPPHSNLPERLISVQVPASAIQANQLHAVFTGPIITTAIALPVPLATSLLQQHVNSTFDGLPGFIPGPVPHPVHLMAPNSNNMMQQQQIIQTQQQGNIAQLDGAGGESSDEDDEEEDDENDDEEDIDDDKEDDENDSGAREEEPLNSEDDVTDDDPVDLFETDNVVVCQYDKITRSRNKWKFYLKDGIMNLNGKDYVFQKSNGDAEW